MPLGTSFHTKLASGRWPSRNSKRREVLSVNMISLPLADFRHISHIGNSAHRDSFGDLSFLKMGHGLLLQSSQSEQNLFMACSPPPKPPRLNAVETRGSKPSDGPVHPQHNIYQKRKKCSSLPLLDSNEEETEEEDGDQNGNLSPGKTKVPAEPGDKTTATTTTEDDGGFSFSLDLGPSILDDVLRVMDKLHN